MTGIGYCNALFFVVMFGLRCAIFGYRTNADAICDATFPPSPTPLLCLSCSCLSSSSFFFFYLFLPLNNGWQYTQNSLNIHAIASPSLPSAPITHFHSSFLDQTIIVHHLLHNRAMCMTDLARVIKFISTMDCLVGACCWIRYLFVITAQYYRGLGETGIGTAESGKGKESGTAAQGGGVDLINPWFRGFRYRPPAYDLLGL